MHFEWACYGLTDLLNEEALCQRREMQNQLLAKIQQISF